LKLDTVEGLIRISDYAISNTPLSQFHIASFYASEKPLDLI